MTAAEYVAHRRSRGARVIDRRRYWMVTCPAHDDREPSLKVSVGHAQGLVLHCFGGCSADDVLAADGLTWAQLLNRTHERTRSIVVGGMEPCDHHHGEHWHPLTRDLFQCIANQASSRVRLDGKPPQVERDSLERDVEPHHVFTITTPKRSGKWMRVVLEDVIEAVNERRERGELRAVPYGSEHAAKRIAARLGSEVDPRRVRGALEALVKAGALVPQGELGRTDGKRYGGTPLYALGVEPPCPLSACEVEGAAFVALDDEPPSTAGDAELAAQPAVEVGEQQAVAVAEVEDVIGARLAASVGGAGSVGSVGHAEERYARSRRARLRAQEVRAEAVRRALQRRAERASALGGGSHSDTMKVCPPAGSPFVKSASPLA